MELYLPWSQVQTTDSVSTAIVSLPNPHKSSQDVKADIKSDVIRIVVSSSKHRRRELRDDARKIDTSESYQTARRLPGAPYVTVVVEKKEDQMVVRPLWQSRFGDTRDTRSAIVSASQLHLKP
jgi:hypothetical protein